MRRSALLLALVLLGCSSDGDEAPGTTADSAGASGSGGASGQAGSGASGSAGKAGSGAAGASGKAGSAGTSGKAGASGGGQGGSSGKAGAPGAGSSGVGGSAGSPSQGGAGGEAGQAGGAGGGAGEGGSSQAGSGGGGQAGSGQAGSGGSGQAGSGQAGSGQAGSGGSGQAGSGGSGLMGVAIDGRRLVVDGAPFHIKGVCWSPVTKGKGYPEGLDFSGFAPEDIPLMKAAGVNAVRTYEPLTDLSVLDMLDAAGIKVIESVYPYGGAPVEVVTDRVNAVKGHPAVMMWVVGNEWNYNGLYVGLSFDQSLERLNQAASLIKAADPSRPIATVYGEVPSSDTLGKMPLIDMWGLNVYRGISFGDLFDKWSALSDKPMWVSEYGADAWNSKTGAEDDAAQAEATGKLTLEIAAHSAAKDPSLPCSGGTIFEWSDEWWKAPGDPGVHDIGGSAPGGGPYPDMTFNEEWWGIVDIDRKPRPAYDALKTAFASSP